MNHNRGSGNPIRNDNNIFERYHQQLDDFVEKRKNVADQQDVISNRLRDPRPPATPVSRPNSNNNKPVVKNPVLDDYNRRKEEFERNKARGKAVFNNPIMAKPPIKKKVKSQTMRKSLRKYAI